MVSDEKRRDVAGALRYFADYPGRPLQYMEQFINILREVIFSDVCYRADYSEMFQRLADLIDPESGQNLDRNRDTVQQESPAVQKAPECDREELLAEAKEAEKSAWYFALDHDEDELRDRLTEAAEEFTDVARRIREACGVSADE